MMRILSTPLASLLAEEVYRGDVLRYSKRVESPLREVQRKPPKVERADEMMVMEEELREKEKRVGDHLMCEEEVGEEVLEERQRDDKVRINLTELKEYMILQEYTRFLKTISAKLH